MYCFAASLIVISVSLLTFPLAGAWLAGNELAPHLQFPPQTSPATHEPFSWNAWLLMSGVTITVVLLLLFPAKLFSVKQLPAYTQRRYPIPWWGSAGLLLVIVFWILAWNRFSWFADLQVYTYTPLWLGYILIINALTVHRKGHCLLSRQPLYLLGLFVLSSIFWWYYEYLNTFIENWYYLGTEQLTSTQIVIHSSLAYATVLPAVIGTTEWLDTFPKLSLPLQQLQKLSPAHPQAWSFASWLGGSILLGLAAIWPEILYPLVWITPLFVVAGIKYLFYKNTSFSALVHGDWRPLILPALAALFCGFFWELWNVKNLAHWEYNIPYVQQFHLFEMPLLGYAGYLPFGMVCLAVVDLLPGNNRVFSTQRTSGD